MRNACEARGPSTIPCLGLVRTVGMVAELALLEEVGRDIVVASVKFISLKGLPILLVTGVALDDGYIWWLWW